MTVSEEQFTLDHASKICAITTLSIDLPVRVGVALFLGLPAVYPMFSVAAEYSICIQKELEPVCNEHPVICSGIKGAIAYAGRANILGQDILARAVLGIGNNIAYALLGPEGLNPLFIEITEAAIVAMTKEDVLLPNIILGAAIGNCISFCYNMLAKPALQYLNSNGTVTIIEAIEKAATTEEKIAEHAEPQNVKPLGEIANVELPQEL